MALNKMPRVILENRDPFGNNFRVVDANNGDAQLFMGYIAAHGEQVVYPVFNDSGYANIATFQDNGPRVNRSFLHAEDRVWL